MNVRQAGWAASAVIDFFDFSMVNFGMPSQISHIIHSESIECVDSKYVVFII